MIIDKLLIIDDKNPREDYSSATLINSLNKDQLKYVDFFSSTETLWRESSNGDDIDLLKDFSEYSFVLIHDSYNNPLIHDGLLPVLIQKLSLTSKVVLLSGGKREANAPTPVSADQSISPGIVYYEILRRQYHNNLPNFIDSMVFANKFKLEYLYNSYASPRQDVADELLEIILTELEKSAYSAVNCDSFLKLFKLYGLDNINDVKQKFLRMNDDEIIENLEAIIYNQ